MKKTLATLLASATLLSLIPAFGASAAEATTVDGLTMTSYHMTAKTSAWAPNAYSTIIGSDSGDARRGFEENKKFDQSIDELLNWSYELDSADNLTDFSGYNETYVKTLGSPNGDIYLLNWTGTVTASKDVTFTMAADKIDNGFLFELDGVRYYEYWGASHWFDDTSDPGDPLKSDLGAITLKAGQSYKVNAWFLELNGGEALDIGGYENGSDEYKSLADLGLTFSMSVKAYHSLCDQWGIDSYHQDHPWANVFNTLTTLKGNDGNGGNGAQCVESNFNYDATIEGLLETSKKVGGSFVVPTISAWTPALNGENYINIYSGTFTVEKTGNYLFGCTSVDNGLVIDITANGGQPIRAFELWAFGTWNDNSEAWYPTAVKLEAGKTYTINAAFMELNGGQVVTPVVKYSATDDFSTAESAAIETVLSFKTTAPTDTDMLSAELTAAVIADGTDLTGKVDLDTVAYTGGNLFGDGDPKGAFDGKLDTKLGASGTYGTLTWQTTEATTVTYYSLTNSIEDNSVYLRVPASWTLLGSTDGKTYTILDHVDRGMGGIGNASGASGMYKIDNPGAYTYYRLEINSAYVTADGVSVSEVGLYNYTAPVEPTNPTEPTVPTEPVTPTDPVKPVNPSTGDAAVIAATLSVLALAGVAIVSKKRRRAE